MHPYRHYEPGGILEARIPIIEQIRDITRQPSLSIGVIHHGHEVFKYNTGFLDLTTGQKPDSNSLYCISSLSKAFMATALDLLVQQEKLSWDAKVNSVIPEFKHFQQPESLVTMSIRDICSHRTGLKGLDEITQGVDARILISKKDIVKVCNTLPIKHDLRTNFLYNNTMYELAGNIVERISGLPTWGDFHRQHIFDPLGMSRTTAFRSVHGTDNNIATPYMILTDGMPSKIAPTELSADSMNGGSGGIRSSVNDLLKWCKCLLGSFNNNLPADRQLVQSNSPIWNRTTIVNPKSETPAKLGLISPNRGLISPILGSFSPSIQLYGHQGDVPGYACSLYIIPESHSAIVILSNGSGLSDATDWIAQDLIQTLYALQPAIDLVEVATEARTKYLSQYMKKFKIPLELHRVRGTNLPKPSDFTGSYIMNGLDIVNIHIMMVPDKPDILMMVINRQPDQTWEMWHYHFDVFCHLPDSYDECLSRGLARTLWSSFLVSFVRDQGGLVNGLTWELNGVDVAFSRVSF